MEEPGWSWVKHGYCHHRYCHSLKINASLRCPLGKPAHVDCCWVCGSPAQGRSPKAKKHMLQTSFGFIVHFLVLDGTKLEFWLPGLSGLRTKANICRTATRNHCYCSPTKLAAWIDGRIGPVFSFALQLGLSHEADGLRLAAQHQSASEQVNGIMDTCPLQASLLCFPFFQLMNGFGHLQVELGLPLSLSRFHPLQVGCIFHCYLFLFFGMLWSSSELDRHSP